jgi:membrane protein required for colicin V production
MLDFILGAYLAWLAVRGWVRGFVREVLGLVGLVLGVLIAFRLGGLVGDFLSRSFGMAPEVARITGGVVLFVLLGVALSVGAAFLTRIMRLPGLNLVNRAGGAGVALLWGIAVLLVVVNVARVLPLPDSWDRQFGGSVVVEAVAGPDALPQRIFHRLAGDTVMSALYAIQNLFGVDRVVPGSGEVLEIPSASPDEIRQVRNEAAVILEELNRHRAGAGVSALVGSDALSDLAERRASESYLEGRLYRTDDCVSDAEDRAGVRLARCTDVVALASTSLAALDAILGDSETGPVTSGPAYDRTGIAVVDGPTGRILVIVLAG